MKGTLGLTQLHSHFEDSSSWVLLLLEWTFFLLVSVYFLPVLRGAICLNLAAITSKSSASDSLLLKVITSTLLDDFEGSERDKLDPVADLPVKPDVGPKFDLIDPYPEFDLIDPDFDLFGPE